MPTSLSIGFFLMTQKGFSVLSSVLSQKERPDISFVVAARDKNIQRDYFEEIMLLCRQFDIPFYNRMDYPGLSADYHICISWRWMIRNNEVKTIVLHDSLLPKYRGFAPLVNQLINKENQIGVTALFAADAFDEGDILFQKAINIDYPITIQEAINQISPLYTELVLDIIRNILKESLPKGFPQKNEEATYSLWRDEEDYYIDWNQESEQIERFIHAVGPPYDSAKTRTNGEVIVIEDARSFPDRKIMNRDVGKVITLDKGYPVIVCGTGLLKILKGHYLKDGRPILPLKKFRSRFL